jgi:hypothetical protein
MSKTEKRGQISEQKKCITQSLIFTRVCGQSYVQEAAHDFASGAQPAESCLQTWGTLE